MNNKLFIFIVVVALLGMVLFLRSRMNKRGPGARVDSQTAPPVQAPAATAKRAREECELNCMSVRTRCLAQHSFDKPAESRCESEWAGCTPKCR